MYSQKLWSFKGEPFHFRMDGWVIWYRHEFSEPFHALEIFFLGTFACLIYFSSNIACFMAVH